MTAQQFMAEHVERMGHSMADYVGSTDPVYLTSGIETKGGEPTRSVLELVSECVLVNHYFAGLLKGENPPKPGALTFANAKDAQDQIIASATVLADAMRHSADGVFEHEFPHWRGPMSGRIIMMGAYRNMAYHCGQINFVQILGGDHEFHMPASWLK